MGNVALFTLATFVSIASSASAQMPFGGPPVRLDVEVVKRFDTNRDGWLNTAERKLAREYALKLRETGRGFPGGRGGRGGPFGFPGFGGEPGPAEKGKAIAPADVKTYGSADFYDESVLRTLFITFDGSDWEKELEDFHGTDVDVPATLSVDGKTYRDVGIRFRGMSSYMGVLEGRKRSLNLSIDMAHDGQNVGGYRTLNLLNSHEDPTLMRAVLFLHIARQYIPAPKANFVRAVINGEYWGVYANVQQFNKDFLKENYREDSGARWKAPGPNPQGGLRYLGEDSAAYKQVYEIKSRDDPAQWAALIDLTRTLEQTPAAELEKALAPMLDVDGALRFLALDNALVNNDGYWSRSSDYSLYRDTTGKFHIIPHDTNETFAAGPGGRGGFGGRPGARSFPPPPFDDSRRGMNRGRGPEGFARGPMMMGNASLDPLLGLDDASKPLRSRLLAVPQLREKYLAYVREIATTWLDWKALGPIVEQYRELVDVDVAADTKKLSSYEAFLASLAGPTNSLKSFAADRTKFLLGLNSRK